MPRLRPLHLLGLAGALTGLVATGLPATAQVPDPVEILTTAPAREAEPVVLTGRDFPGWAVAQDVEVHPGSVEGARCLAGQEEPAFAGPDSCSHNRYEEPLVSTQDAAGLEGIPVDRLVGYRYDADTNQMLEVPLQVDEMFQRHLSNNNSGFGVYSETDSHTSYAFEREGFRFLDSAPGDPCLAVARDGIVTTADPVVGLDTDDEIVFMARDAGPVAPAAALEAVKGIEQWRHVTVNDPVYGASTHLYVGLGADDGARPSFDATNGYVRYARDADADTFRFSESSYDNYGATEHGPWMDDAGVCHSAEDEWLQHRPGDAATITTPRYRFRYDGRWLMTDIRISADEDGDWTYGVDLVDQWKARAFQQRPSGQTPCCGYEEEVNNWGGSSILMGELTGPVRVIRETWGADSCTNCVRREIFYRDEVRLGLFLRVHVIPPVDGIYAQWDYNPMAVTTYYNPWVPEGVAIDGRDDEAFGNAYVHVGPDGVRYDDPGTNGLLGGPIEVGDPAEGTCGAPPVPGLPAYGGWGDDPLCTYNDIDSPDPTFSGPSALLNWEQVAGPSGAIVTRWTLKQATAGSAQTASAVPYYRDDACFDDGTGTSPGPHLRSRGVESDEDNTSQWHRTDAAGRPERTASGEVNWLPRECWDVEKMSDPAYAAALRDTPRRFLQGSIGTHGIHIELIADSDNAHTTLPLTEIDTEQRMVMLPPTLENVGETWGRAFEKPLVATVEGTGPGGLPTGGVRGALAVLGQLVARLVAMLAGR